MSQKRRRDSEEVVLEMKRRTRKKYSGEEKIRIALEGLRFVREDGSPERFNILVQRRRDAVR